MPVRGKTRKDGLPSKGETHRGLFSQYGKSATPSGAAALRSAVKIGSKKKGVGGSKTLTR